MPIAKRQQEKNLQDGEAVVSYRISRSSQEHIQEGQSDF